MKIIAAIIIIFAITGAGRCQETIFNIFKKGEELADEHYRKRSYQQALELYELTADNDENGLKIARCHYFLKNYSQAAEIFEKHLDRLSKDSKDDLYYLAEASATLGRYEKAIHYYQQLLRHQESEVVLQKIWRLNNIHYLYEDSIHYALTPLSNINSENSDICPVRFQNGLAFLSNRKGIGVIEKKDAFNNQPFYKVHFSSINDTSLYKGATPFETAARATHVPVEKFHAGPFAIYDHQHKMIFASTAKTASEDGSRPLQLYFATLNQDRWEITAEFPFNDPHYSLTGPTISDDGKTLIFSSDMPEGEGQFDLYVSRFTDGSWTKPENLGGEVNTPYDEVFPYLKGNTLYFSSDGHAGMGGLDLFKVLIQQNQIDEVENVGYPLNSTKDDFSISFDSLQTHGYLASNRKHGGYDDDLYEFDIDLQTYPYTINGVLRLKEHSWNDSSSLKNWPGIKLLLVDNIRKITVHETVTDNEGNFSLNIPWFSKYRIEVKAPNEEHVVSLEIPRQRKEHTRHEIVVIKDEFTSQDIIR